jgi:hypothetical protein
LVVKTYYAYGLGFAVGLQIHVVYEPHAGDPLTNIHWIQVASGNHEPGGTHGVAFSKVDTPSVTTPYYDDGGVADQRNFFDQANMTDANQAHAFSFELYLVQETAPNTAVFWGGILWGWCNGPMGGEGTCSAN